MEQIKEGLKQWTLATLGGVLLSLVLVLVLALCLPANSAYAVVPPSLSIAKPGSGSGVVTSNTGGINCGGVCVGSYLPGTLVTLTATPDPYSVFLNWGVGACAGAGASSSCTLTTGATGQTAAAYFRGATVAAGYSHTVALKSDGTVWAWGATGTASWGPVAPGTVRRPSRWWAPGATL